MRRVDVVTICVVTRMEKKAYKKSEEQNKGVFVQLRWESK